MPKKNKTTRIKLPTKKRVMAAAPKDHILLIFGPPGTGKTKFVDSLAERVLFLSTDRGTRTYEMLRIECTTWEQLIEAVELLEEAEGDELPDMVCFDHVDDFAAMAEDYILQQLKIDGLGDAGFGKGWKAYRDEMRHLIRRVMNLGVGVTFIAHEDQKTITVEGLERTILMPSMSKSAWRVIVPMVDLVGFTSIRRMKVKDPNGGKAKKTDVYTLQTQPTADIYAKDRTRRRRPKGHWEVLDGKKFLASFEHGQEKQETGVGTGNEVGRGRRAGGARG